MTTEKQHSELAHEFERLYGAKATIFSAPGRVNLIGEHTDYNDGFVMPSALGFSTSVAIAPSHNHSLVLRSREFSDQFKFEAGKLPESRTGAWCDYVLGVAVTLQRSGYAVPGANLLVDGDVPIGAGLSSSAAIEVASALAFMSLTGTKLPLVEVAKLCRQAENSFVGARVGIMDQFVSCLGKAGHALLLDCRSLDFKPIPIPKNVQLVICNTMVKHALASNEYNRRREECDEGVRILAKLYPQVRALRDVTEKQLKQHAPELPERIYKRCLHVVQENQRTLDFAECLTSGDLGRAGELMRGSHRSLRDLYEVSCSELDIMVEAAQGLPGHHGSRMTGGGFGGCTVNLVSQADAPAFAKQIAERYRSETGIVPDIYICNAADGAGRAA